MASIQILSDLHLEAPDAYDTFDIHPKAPYLALLGDIGQAGRQTHRKPMLDFLRVQLRNFRAVYFVPGNHEVYHSTWPETLAVLRDFEQDVSRRRASEPSIGCFVLMDRTSVRLPCGDAPNADDGVLLLGCSLFSKVPRQRMARVEMSLTDFYVSGEEWTVRAHNEAHERDLSWLNDQVRQAEQDDSIKKIVILTHWSPSVDPKALEPRHIGSEIACAFSTNLRGEICWTSPKVRSWACGHTHYNFDFEADRGGDRLPIRLFTNQRGYDWDVSEGFDDGKVLDL